MNSGIVPKGNRVVIKPDQLEEVTSGGIVIPATERDRHQMAQITGIVVALGPDCWQHTITTVERFLDNKWVPFERKVTGYSEPFAEIGDRVSFAKYGGLPTVGEDGEEYRLINDEDITGVVSEKVDFSQFKKRERMS